MPENNEIKNGPILNQTEIVGAVNTASETHKKKKNTGLIVCIILIFIFIATTVLFAVLYFTDSNLFKKKNSVAVNKVISSESEEEEEEKESKKEIDGSKFTNKLEKLDWTVTDYTALIALDTSGESDGMKEMLMASKDDSNAMFVTFEKEKEAKNYYQSGVEEIEVELETEEGLHTKKSEGENFESIYIWGESDGEEGWVKISRVGKTFLMIQGKTEEDFKEADKALGY